MKTKKLIIGTVVAGIVFGVSILIMASIIHEKANEHKITQLMEWVEYRIDDETTNDAGRLCIVNHMAEEMTATEAEDLNHNDQYTVADVVGQRRADDMKLEALRCVARNSE